MLNLVHTTVDIDGVRYNFKKLQLHQAFNTHHEFRIEIDYEEFGGQWMDDPGRIIALIGTDVTIEMKHRHTGEENLFRGLVTNVSHSGYHGLQNSIIISGKSPTIKLSGNPTMDSFTGLSLDAIVKEAVQNSGNGGEVTVSPAFKSKIEYLCQYGESCFDFLNRLSWEFGEWFYYDGLKCLFGKQNCDDVTIEYDKEMTFFDLTANLVPSNFNRYHYFSHEDREMDRDAPDNVSGVRGYLQASLNRSKSIYTASAKNPSMTTVNFSPELNDLVKAEKSRLVGEMLIMRGETQTCKVKIGRNIAIRLPKTMKVISKDVDTFLVTSVTHIVDQKGHYSNSFEGIVSGIEAIPMIKPAMPVANPQVATVMSNDDVGQSGRVMVQTQWQKIVNKSTNWIRVQTVDAGKSSAVSKNRGHLFIPEVGDIVMLGFEYGDPSRPFVMGSIFSEKVSAGGGADNARKSITTRSGITIVFDDNQRSLHIEDPSGNTWDMDGKGNITVSAVETMTLLAKNMHMEITEDMTINIGKSSRQTVGENLSLSVTGNLSAGSDKNINIAAKQNIGISTEAGLNAEAVKDVTLNTEGDIVIETSAGEMQLASRGELFLKSDKNVNNAN